VFPWASAAQNPLWCFIEKREAPREFRASVAVSSAHPLSPAASKNSRAGRERLMILLPLWPRRSASADARWGGLQRRCVGIPVTDPFALRRRALSFTVGLGRHVHVLGVDLRHDELPEFDELLELFGGHHVPELERLHPPLGAIAQCLKRLDAALLGRKVSRVEADGIQRASESID